MKDTLEWLWSKLPSRDSWGYTLTTTAAVIIYASAHTNLIPVEWRERAQDVAAVMGLVSAKLGWSSAPMK